MPPLLLILVVWFHFQSLCCLPSSVPAQFHNESNSDRQALLCLKSQLHDPPGAFASWRNQSSAICNWNSCWNFFTGVIPSLGSLPTLTYLDVGDNMLEAGGWTFISSLTNCTKLQNLWLDRNNLQGIIPLSITNLSKSLNVLILIHNKLTGSIPSEIDNLTGLNVLQMDRNLLSGQIPDTLVNLKNLSILSLSNNKLSGEIPQQLEN